MSKVETYYVIQTDGGGYVHLEPEEYGSDTYLVFSSPEIYRADFWSWEETNDLFLELTDLKSDKYKYVTYSRAKDIIKVDFNITNMTQNRNETDDWFDNLPSIKDRKAEIDKQKERIVKEYIG